MAQNSRIKALIVLILISTNMIGYDSNSYDANNNASSNSNSPFAAITNQERLPAQFKAPTLNAFGDSSLNNPNWDTVDFTNSDNGTAGWNGGGGGKGATSGKNPFGFPDEDFTPEQGVATTLAVE